MTYKYDDANSITEKIKVKFYFFTLMYVLDIDFRQRLYIFTKISTGNLISSEITMKKLKSTESTRLIKPPIIHSQHFGSCS